MENDTPNALAEDWELLMSFFPADWRKQAQTCGALKGLRQDKSVESYLRVLLLHWGGGFSLRETIVRAQQAGLADLSDVALEAFAQEQGLAAATLLRAICRAALLAGGGGNTAMAAAGRQFGQ